VSWTKVWECIIYTWDWILVTVALSNGITWTCIRHASVTCCLVGSCSSEKVILVICVIQLLWASFTIFPAIFGVYVALSLLFLEKRKLSYITSTGFKLFSWAIIGLTSVKMTKKDLNTLSQFLQRLLSKSVRNNLVKSSTPHLMASPISMETGFHKYLLVSYYIYT